MKNNLLYHKMTIIFVVLSFFVEAGFAQETININDGAMASLRQSSVHVSLSDGGVRPQRSRMMKFNPRLRALSAVNRGDRLQLDLFDDRRYNAIIERIETDCSGVLGLTARIEGDEAAFCHIAVSQYGETLVAMIPSRDEAFVATVENGQASLRQHRLSALQQAEKPCEELFPSEEKTGRALLRAAQDDETLPDATAACGLSEMDSEVTIDVLIVYTPAAEAVSLQRYTSIENLISTWIATANTVMANTQTGITFRLVHVAKTNYTESGSSYTDLPNLRNDNDRFMDEVHNLRYRYQADLVMLIASVTDTGGLGYVLNTESGYPDWAFALTSVYQGLPSYSMVHEIGHNMGCSHDITQFNPTDAATIARGYDALYEYSFGYHGVNSDGNFATVMTYESLADGYFPRIPYFSTPDLKYKDVPIGRDSCDNRQSLRRAKRLVSLYSDISSIYFNSLSVNGFEISPTFDSDMYSDIEEYVVTVPVGTTEITISATPSYDCATVSNAGTNTLVGDETIIDVMVYSHHPTAAGLWSNHCRLRVLRQTGTPPTASAPAFGPALTEIIGSSNLNLNLPEITNHVYIAVRQSDDRIVAQSATGNFQSLASGIYTIYGFAYIPSSPSGSSAQRLSPSSATYIPEDFVGKLLPEIEYLATGIRSSTSQTITILPEQYVWTPQITTPNDWNEPSNWTPTIVPSASARVIIPASASYPVLEAATTVDQLELEAGAELGRQDFLTANRVGVAFNFGNDGTAALARAKSHLLTVPLRQVYSGDFTFGGYPSTFLYNYQKDVDGKGEWQPISDLNVPLLPGQGFALWISEEANTGSGVDAPFGSESRNYGLGQTGDILRLPYFDRQTDSEAHRIHFFDAENSESRFYSWSNSANHPLTDNYATAPRTAAAGQLVETTVEGDYTVTATVGSDNENGKFALVGNPFISTIDFEKFYADNSDKIGRRYYIWTGNSYSTYTKDGSTGEAPVNRYIAPMQAFFVEISGSAPDPVTLNFNIVSQSIAAQAPFSVLRSSEPEGQKNNKLEITATTGDLQYMSFIALRDYGSPTFCQADARIFSEEINETPEVYTLKDSPEGQIPLSANIVNTNEIDLPVGLATTTEGEITLTFTGMDDYESRILFIDRLLKVEYDMTGMSEFSYPIFFYPPKTGDAVVAENSRFLLRFRRSTQNIETLTDTSEAKVYSSGNQLFVSTDLTDPIVAVEIVNLAGQIVRSERNINASTFSVVLPVAVPQTYIVRLTTRRNAKSFKIIINMQQ